ncbi:MAG: diguanylate cyclase [Deltaproteobacteria bacterium]|nr:diguanylate cyclase [Deltaproteobacteria bacterium]
MSPSCDEKNRDKKILVVDDNRTNVQTIKRILEERKFKVFEAENGQEAISRVRDLSPDLVLLDLVMPKLNGIEVTRILKNQERFKMIPIVLLTAADSVESKVKCLDSGADEFLSKPVNPLELVARVQSMLRIKSLNDDLLSANEKLKEVNQKLKELSITDPLTGLHNRLYLQMRIGHEFERADRYRSYLSCAMADIDHFKKVNDTYGHAAGDAVLQHIARVFMESIRKIDLAARFGGEEFVFILPETDEDEAILVSERIRASVEASPVVFEGRTILATVSIGIVTFPHHDIENEDQLIDCADKALYRAKNSGRNRVEKYD